MSAVLQYVLYFAVLVVLAIPLGRFMAHIMDGERTFLSPVLIPSSEGSTIFSVSMQKSRWVGSVTW